MSDRILDLSVWPRAVQFRLFRTYAKPHYAVTVRLDATVLMTRRKPAGQSPYRATGHAISSGIQAVPELRTRFRGDVVTEYAAIDLSMTVPLDDGTFGFGFVGHAAGYAEFAKAWAVAEDEVRAGLTAPNHGMRDDLAYLSCLPWLDYTSLDNAIGGPEDCIPRVSWGKITQKDSRHEMPMTIECHHALVDGAHVGRFFEVVQTTLDDAP